MIDGAGFKYYYAHDAQGNVIALLNSSGAVVEAYSYGPFGETTVHIAAGTDNVWLTGDDTIASTAVSAYGNPYMYTARRLDDESGLYYYRARHYSTKIKRFLQPDPIGYGDGMNMYAYSGNNPVNFVDPWGLKDKHMGINNKAKRVAGKTTVGAAEVGQKVIYVPHLVLVKTPVAVVKGVIISPAKAIYGFFRKMPKRTKKARNKYYHRYEGQIDDPNVNDLRSNQGTYAEDFKDWGKKTGEEATGLPGIGSTGKPVPVPTSAADLASEIINQVGSDVNNALSKDKDECPKK